MRGTIPVRRCILLSTLLMLLLAPAVSAAGSDSPVLARATCQDSVWEDAEFCGHDARIATGDAEMNHDCIVDILDAALFYREFAGLTSGLSGDLDGDSDVDISDLQLFTASMGASVSPCEAGGMGADGCGGSLSLSLDPDPQNVVSTGSLPAGIHWLYLVADGVEGASTVGFGLSVSANITLFQINPARPGSGVFEDAFGDHVVYKALSYNSDLPAGPVVVAELLIQVIDTSGSTLELMPGWWCGEDRVRWAPSAHDRSHDFLSCSHLALNGTSLPEPITTCGDVDPPRLLWAGTPDPDELTLVFDEPLDQVSVENDGVYLIYETNDPLTTIPVSAVTWAGGSVVLALGSPLLPDVVYTVEVTGVRDGVGNPIGAQNSAQFVGPSAIPDIVIPCDDLVARNFEHLNVSGPDTFVLAFYDFDDENGIVPQWQGWTSVDRSAEVGPAVGDFSTLDFIGMDGVPEPDPCRTNPTPQVLFCPPTEYGGLWVYGPDGRVVPPGWGLHNEIWSPEIEWDLEGPDDDEVENRGAYLRVAVWEHLPLDNGLYYTWRVRSSEDGGATWSAWQTDGLAYYQPAPQYAYRTFDLTHFLVDEPTHLQVALGVWDLSSEYPATGTDPTPSPGFDRVEVAKHLTSPQLRIMERDLLQDGFPPVGDLVALAMSDRHRLDIPLDAAHDPIDDGLPRPTSTLEVVVRPQRAVDTIPPEEVKLFWHLELNPFFEMEIRSFPPGTDIVWPDYAEGFLTGHYVGPFGPGNSDRYLFDLPDEDFLYPGDVFRYYVQITDDRGWPETLPHEISGFADGLHYDPRFVVHGLPGIQNADGDHPTTLWLNLAGHREHDAAIVQGFHENSLHVGDNLDVYTVQAPDFARHNGIGSAGGHGATLTQLAGYTTLFVTGEDRYDMLLSDGSGIRPDDDGDDLSLLSGWHALSGDRYAAFFGNNLVQANARTASGTAFTNGVLGVDYLTSDARVGLNTYAPSIEPLIPGFSTAYSAYGACRWVDGFDEIDGLPGTVVGHEFLIGGPFGGSSGIAASVLYDRLDGPDRKVDITFPYGLSFVWHPLNVPSKRIDVPTARGYLIGEILDYFGDPHAIPPTDNPPGSGIRAFAARVYPNPFNPLTQVEFDLPREAPVWIDVYDLAGRRVRCLEDGAQWPEGRHRLSWDGRDGRGASVASGVYVVRVRLGDEVHTEKVALVR